MIKILTEPAAIFVIGVFLGITIYFIVKLQGINKELLKLLTFLKDFKKSELIFRFKELDDWMDSNPYVSALWMEFKNTLMFSESVSLQDEKNEGVYEEVSPTLHSVNATVEPAFFFNEETLVTSRMNYKFIQVTPALLTGFGPLFTFLNIGIAFSVMDFSNAEATMVSVAQLMHSMELSSIVSLLAILTSLIFIVIEKVSFNMKCKVPLLEITEGFNKLFDNISSEKFLIELLKETKIQNNNTRNLLAAMPAQFKLALDKSLTTTMTPYLDNLLFGINKVKDNTTPKKGKSDVVDDMF